MDIKNPPPMMHFPYTQVFTGTAPAAATDLDLSAVVGVRQAYVVLRLYNNSGAGEKYHFRKNGETIAASGFGIANTSSDLVTNRHSLFSCVTDGSGIIEWWGDNNAAGVTIHVEAYCHA